MMAELASMPVFTASAPMSAATASIWAATISGGSSCTAVTRSVFCAVTAVMADVPYTPRAANVLRSAWMPAPPPESDPATVMAVGGRALLCRCVIVPSTAPAQRSGC